ncbi:unnamed protein product [Leptidea sinapis]|uniref:Uncharacterized protein n=1 Tax=Leptidea sinapis TaxID=189913 RepID=A0A5E4Q261_9NEOP|nr:unnamed protein product [Leptidea sinapis]
MLIKNQSMESITNFCVSLIKGFIDSLRGVTVLLYLDKEINERALSRSPQPDVDVSRHKLLKQPKVKQRGRPQFMSSVSKIIADSLFSLLVQALFLVQLHKRLTFIETNWPYFLGFGLPLAVLTQIPQSYIISGCVFSIFFPVFILSGNEATPVTGSYILNTYLWVLVMSSLTH